MNKTLCILTCLLACFPLVAADTAPAVQEELDKAAALYFDYKQDKALEAYIALSKETRNKDAFLNAAFIAMEQGQPKTAADILSAARAAHPEDPKILEFAAEAYLADGQYATAEKFLSQIDRETDRAEFYHILLARAQMGMNEPRLAKYNLQTAAKGKSHIPLSNYLLGIMYEQEGNWKDAAEAFRKASVYDHQFIEAKKHYAAALAKLGNYNEAYRQYRMIYTSDKSSTEIKKAMDALRPRLTKEEKDTPPNAGKEILKHTYVRRILPNEENPRYIRVGLGARINGKPAARTRVNFIPSHAFTITDGTSKKIIAKGKAKENWVAVLQDAKAYLLSPDGKKIPFAKSVKITHQPRPGDDGETIIVKNVMSGAGMTWASVGDKEYRGELEIIHNAQLNTLVPVNIVTLDEYLAGVIASEMPTKFPIEALRSQAVLARTYALKHSGKHRAYGYDVCDAQNCQVYGGVTAESERGNAAVESTMGQIMTYKNKPIESVFSANCGGITQSSKAAGWNATAYLNPVSDYKEFDFDKLQPYHFHDLLQHPQNAYSRYDKHVSPAAYRWARVVDETELREVIKNQKKDIGRITAIVPLQRAQSGYVSKILVKGTKGTVTLNKENVIRNNLSLGMLRSSYFIVQPNYEKRQLKSFIFYGGGWGHGVGFCQTGSAGRAEEGQDYKTILQHYFPLAEFTDTSIQ